MTMPVLSEMTPRFSELTDVDFLSTAPPEEFICAEAVIPPLAELPVDVDVEAEAVEEAAVVPPDGGVNEPVSFTLLEHT